MRLIRKLSDLTNRKSFPIFVVMLEPAQRLKIAAVLFILLSGCAGLEEARKEMPDGRLHPRRGAGGPAVSAAPLTRPAEDHRIVDYEIASWYQFKKAACSLTFDDGTLDQFLLAYPELEKRNIKATFFLITGQSAKGYWNDNPVSRKVFSWDQAREIALSGHEIGSHSKSHPDFLLEKDSFEEELRDSRDKIEKEIPWQKGLTFCWPYWRNDKESRAAAGKYYLGARAGVGIPGNYPERNGGIPRATPDDFFRINAIGARNSDPNASLRKLCDRVFSSGGWFVPAFHGIDDGKIERDALGWEALPIRRFRVILDYLRGKGFWLAPFGTVIRYIKERDAAKLSLKNRENRSNRSLTLKLEDGLDDSLFNQALSLRVKLSMVGKRFRGLQNGRMFEIEVDGNGYLIFEALPDGSNITITRL